MPTHGVEVADFDNGEPAFGERGLGNTVGEAAEEELIRPDAEADGDVGVVPSARAAAEVDAVGNAGADNSEALQEQATQRFKCREPKAEHDAPHPLTEALKIFAG